MYGHCPVMYAAFIEHGLFGYGGGNLLNRLIAALFSTVVSSLIFSIVMYTPVSQRQPNTWYDPFGSGLPVYLIIFASVYIIGGIPCSLLIDKFTKKNDYETHRLFDCRSGSGNCDHTDSYFLLTRIVCWCQNSICLRVIWFRRGVDLLFDPEPIRYL